MELLGDDATVGVYCLYNRGGEKGETLDGDVVKKEYEGGGKSDGTEDTKEDLRSVELVQDFGGRHTL